MRVADRMLFSTSTEPLQNYEHSRKKTCENILKIHVVKIDTQSVIKKTVKYNVLIG